VPAENMAFKKFYSFNEQHYSYQLKQTEYYQWSLIKDAGVHSIKQSTSLRLL